MTQEWRVVVLNENRCWVRSVSPESGAHFWIASSSCHPDERPWCSLFPVLPESSPQCVQRDVDLTAEKERWTPSWFSW
jgi:hypothetical protein